MGPATRRQFLKRMAHFSALGGASAFAANLSAFNAFGANAEGHKALVCVFLFGGMDGHDFLIPYDASSYAAWRNIRAPLSDATEYNGTRDRENLLPLTGVNQGGREFALTEDMRPLHELFESGKAAIVGNVGPLIEPTTRAGYTSGAATVPPRLFSHNDQQSIWMASQPEGARYGWGGKLADAFIESGQISSSTFTAISLSGNAVFLSGEHARQFQVGVNGPVMVDAINRPYYIANPDVPPIVTRHLNDLNGAVSNLFEQDIVDLARFSLSANQELDQALENAAPTSDAFPIDNGLSRQLAVVAQIISQQPQLGTERQVFFVSAGGFDTHSNQATTLPDLQIGIASALRGFHDTLESMGRENDVTTFTASDFGRTLQVNGDGTDHGWGNHHLVMGGAVNGGQMLGNVPPPEFDHDQDSGRGRLIPSTSVDQYAGAFGKWFGLTDTELNDALPGLRNFDAAHLAGLFK